MEARAVKPPAMRKLRRFGEKVIEGYLQSPLILSAPVEILLKDDRSQWRGIRFREQLSRVFDFRRFVGGKQRRQSGRAKADRDMGAIDPDDFADAPEGKSLGGIVGDNKIAVHAISRRQVESFAHEQQGARGTQVNW